MWIVELGIERGPNEFFIAQARAGLEWAHEKNAFSSAASRETRNHRSLRRRTRRPGPDDGPFRTDSAIDRVDDRGTRWQIDHAHP